ncbi:MAG: class I SAM-dependent RNA methyltransferase [Promethearchaeota archaeon]
MRGREDVVDHEKTLFENLEKRRLKRASREATLRIERWAADGTCVAHDDEGKLVLVRFAIPGELVRANIYKEAPTHALAEPLEVIEASPKRVKPRCQYFSKCGGCDYQMYSHADQLEVKRQFVREVYRNVAGLDVEFDGTLASPDPFHYRNTMTFKVDPRRRKVGFFRRDTKFIVDVDSCAISMPGINRALAAARTQPDFPSYNFKVRTTLDGDTVAHWIPIEGFEDRDVHEKVTAAGETLEFKISKDSFFQVNDRLIPAWIEKIVGFLDAGGSERVLDLYCGIGLITLFAACRSGHATGVEIARPSIRDARHNAELNGLESRVEFVRGAVEEVLPELGGADVVIVDPPRKGLALETLEAVLELAPRKVIYSSCMPSTMARDVETLSGAYALEELYLVDMFPQTHHVELLGLLEGRE